MSCDNLDTKEVEKMKKTSLLKKLASLFIAALLALSLVGCGANALTPSELATTVVGTVGEYEVLYEELYFLASNYYVDGMSEEELEALVYEDIVTNHAILTLCDKYGVSVDADELEDATDEYINEIADELGGSGAYKDFLSESSSTDHYARFTARCNLLYNELPMALALSGELLTDIDEVTAYIKENFVRTRHFMIANNEGDDPAKNMLIAEMALAELRMGKTTVYDLIGGKYNEDLLIPFDGYTFGLGSMEQAYEDAAFALEVGEISDIVTAMGELANGEYVECYYIIERLDLTEDFIKENYDELESQYAGTVAAKLLEETVEALTFTPNEYCNSLTLTSLEPVTPGTDTVLIYTLIIIAAVLIVATVVIILVVRKLRANSASRLAIKKAALESAASSKQRKK